MVEPGRLKIRENDTWRYTGHGVQGTSGMSGWSGVSGQSGWSGESGYSGYSSYSGISGQSGWSSHSGISGQSGWSGESGQSGTSGISGWSGLQGLQGEPGPAGTTTLSGLSVDVSKAWGGYGISGMGWMATSGPINISDTNGALGGIRFGSPPDVFLYRTTPGNLAISGALKVRTNMTVGAIPTSLFGAAQTYSSTGTDNDGTKLVPGTGHLGFWPIYASWTQTSTASNGTVPHSRVYVTLDDSTLLPITAEIHNASGSITLTEVQIIEAMTSRPGRYIVNMFVRATAAAGTFCTITNLKIYAWQS